MQIKGKTMLMLEYKDIGWRYWLLTAIALSGGVIVDAQFFLLAITITVINLGHLILREGSLKSFPVQVRLCFLALLLIAQPEPMRWLYWLPTIGIWLQIIFGYCLMARIVALLPWHRDEPLSTALLARIFLSRPVRGSVKQGFAAVGVS